MIDLNSEEFATKEGKKQFNGNKAGVTCGVKVGVSKKQEGDHENAPDYKIEFTDSEGGVVDKAIYYPEPGNATQLKTIGKVVVHIFHTVKGNKDPLPPFKDEKHMVDEAMKLLRSATGVANVVTNFGSGDPMYQKRFMEVKAFAPFFELNVDPENTRLFNGKKEFLVPKEADDTPTFTGDNGDADGTEESSDW